MCRKLKKSLLTLLVVFLVSVPVFAQEDLFDWESFNQTETNSMKNVENLQLDLDLLKPNWMNESETSNDLNLTSTKQDVSQMTSLEILDNFESWIAEKEAELAMRKSIYQNLENEYNSMKNILDDSKKRCQDLKAALASNKDDTRYITELWTDALGKIESLEELLAAAEKRERNSLIYENIVTPLPGLAIMTWGFVEMGCGNTDKGWRIFTTGVVTLVGMEVCYQGGKWLFKIW